MEAFRSRAVPRETSVLHQFSPEKHIIWRSAPQRVTVSKVGHISPCCLPVPTAGSLETLWVADGCLHAHSFYPMAAAQGHAELSCPSAGSQPPSPLQWGHVGFCMVFSVMGGAHLQLQFNTVIHCHNGDSGPHMEGKHLAEGCCCIFLTAMREVDVKSLETEHLCIRAFLVTDCSVL